jgi:O-antigen/teichoic acid export membrane protein
MTTSSAEPRPGPSASPSIRGGSAATALVFGSRLFRSLGRVLLLVAVARAFSVAELASFAFHFAVGSLLGVAADAGLTEYVAREIAAAGLHHPRLERKALRLRTGTFLGSIAVALSAEWAWSGNAGLSALGPTLAGAGFVFLDYLSSTARANARYDRDLAYNLVLLAALLACLGGSHLARLDYFAFQLLLGAVVTTVLLAAAVLRLGSLAGGAAEGSVPTSVALFGQARWFLLRALISWCFSDLPIVLLRHLSTSLQVSLFSLAMRSVGFVTQVFVVLGFVFYPALSNARRVSEAGFFDKTITLTLVNTYVMPAAFAACLLGGSILLAASGEAYQDAWMVLQVLALGHVLNLGGFSALPLVAAGLEKRVGVLMLAGLAVFAGGAWLCMPRLGALGAAAALITSFSFTKVYLGVLYRRHHIPLGGRAFALPFAALGALLLVGLLVPLSLKVALLAPLTILSCVLTFKTIRRVAIF